jgi:hypothetical protein
MVVYLDTAMTGTTARGSGEWREVRYTRNGGTSWMWWATYAWDPAVQTDAAVLGVTSADQWAQFRLTRLPISLKTSFNQVMSASSTGAFGPITTTALTDAEQLTVEVNSDGSIYLKTKYNTYLNLTVTGIFSLVTTPGINSMFYVLPQSGTNQIYLKFVNAAKYMGSYAAGTIYFASALNASDQLLTMVWSL